MLDPDGQRLYEVFSALLQLVDKAHNQAAYTAKVYEERGHGDELVQQMDTLRMLHDAVQQEMKRTMVEAQRVLQEISRPVMPSK